MPASFATPANASAGLALVQAVAPDILADYGTWGVEPTLPMITAWLSDPSKRTVIWTASGLKGVELWQQDADGWRVLLVGAHPSLTTAQRTGAFAAMSIFMAQTLPGSTPISGVVRRNRRLDTLMNGLAGFTRTPTTLNGLPMAKFTTTASAVITRFASAAVNAP